MTKTREYYRRIRRMQREMQTFRNNYPEYEELYEYDYESLTNTHELIILIDNHRLKIKMGQYFPFKAPQVFINDNYYRDMLVFRTEYFQNILKINGYQCLCCTSILCTSKWSPTSIQGTCASFYEAS